MSFFASEVAMPASELQALLFLACWLEYHSDIPAARAFVARVFGERTQRNREFGIAWRKRWYSSSELLHTLSLRASPFMDRIKAIAAREAADLQALLCGRVDWRLVPYNGIAT